MSCPEDLKPWYLEVTVKWGESGLAERVGTKLRPPKTETYLHEQTFWFSEALRRSIENSLCTTENSPVQSILVFKVLKFVPTRPASPDSPHFSVYHLPVFLHAHAKWYEFQRIADFH